MSAPSTKHEPRSFRGLRAGVVGLGLEGQDIVRFLHREGATEIMVSDRKPADALQSQVQALAGIPFVLEAGGNDTSLAERVDVLFVSQGVPANLPLLQEAQARALPVTAMMRLFLQRCPAPVTGITGSAGKTTTTALVGEILRAAGTPVFVGGNIGVGLLEALPQITAKMTVVVEISHTQLARTDRSPHVAAVLNVTPNHLDQFRWDAYVDLKRNLVRYQTTDDIVVLPIDNETAYALGADTPARPYFFGLEALPGPGATVRDGAIVWEPAGGGGGSQNVLPIAAVQLPGEHNLRNILAAVAICGAGGAPPQAMAAAIAGFTGVPHRLQTVAVAAGVRFVDDSIATAPERTVAALRAIAGPIVLLLGGREKRLPLQPLAREALGTVRTVICFGEAGPGFAAFLRGEWSGRADAPSIRETSDLPEAVEVARRASQPGDAVLLSPAATSFDAYENFVARGDHFAALVAALPSARSGARREADDGPR